MTGNGEVEVGHGAARGGSALAVVEPDVVRVLFGPPKIEEFSDIIGWRQD